MNLSSQVIILDAIIQFVFFQKVSAQYLHTLVRNPDILYSGIVQQFQKPDQLYEQVLLSGNEKPA